MHADCLGFFSYEQQKSAPLSSAERSTGKMRNRCGREPRSISLKDPLRQMQALCPCSGVPVVCEAQANLPLPSSLVFKKEASGSDKTAIHLRFVIFKYFCFPGLTLGMAQEIVRDGEIQSFLVVCVLCCLVCSVTQNVMKTLMGRCSCLWVSVAVLVGISRSHVTSY